MTCAHSGFPEVSFQYSIYAVSDRVNRGDNNEIYKVGSLGLEDCCTDCWKINFNFNSQDSLTHTYDLLDWFIGCNPGSPTMNVLTLEKP